MGKNRRVVVTGMGAITPIGNSVEEFWNGIKEGKTGFGPITYFDTADYRCKLAAEVKDFDPAQYMDKKSARRMEQFCQFAVAAAGQAIADAGLIMEQEDPYMVGCSVGSGIGSLQAMEREYDRLKEKGPGRVGPMLVPLMISNMAAGNVSIAYGLKGKSLNVVTACATGTHSIGEAYRTIQYGDADVMIAGGTESSITPIGIAGFSALTALSFSEDPERASIPFDKERNGFVMGEGSAIVVLEELEHALARGAKIYAEITGYGATCDAYHMTAPLPDGSGGAKAMALALSDGQTNPDSVDYINAHGTGTHMNDSCETAAIHAVFGDHAKDIAVVSTKSMTGHLLGASGAVEAVFCVLALKDGFVPATINYQVPDPECDLDVVPNTGRTADIRYALSNSLGFGGHNACLVFQKWEG